MRSRPPEPPATIRRHWLLTGVTSMLCFVVVLAFVLATSGLDAFDAAVTADVIGVRSPAATTLASTVTSLGSVPAVMAVSLLVAGALWWRTGTKGPSLLLLSAVGVTAGFVFILKIAVSRIRPTLDTVLGTASTDYSFPSGHTTNGSVVYLLSAILLAATIERSWRRPLLVTIGAGLGLAIGLTRVYLGYHWATDVLAGWLLALTVIAGAELVTGLQLVYRDGTGARTPQGRRISFVRVRRCHRALRFRQTRTPEVST
jgi:membrane-associated phospholipid phosphatase